MGAAAFDRIASFEHQANDVVIEIGSERGEGSTAYLKEYCNKHNLKFYSIDINPQVDGVIKADGAEWLKTFKGTIGFAYLDNFDYIFDHIKEQDWLKEQVKDYAKLGIVMNNENSEKAHLEQAKLVHKHSRIGTEILFDDTWLEGVYKGKGAQAVPYLLNNGYELVHAGKNYSSYVHVRRTV